MEMLAAPDSIKAALSLFLGPTIIVLKPYLDGKKIPMPLILENQYSILGPCLLRYQHISHKLNFKRIRLVGFELISLRSKV